MIGGCAARLTYGAERFPSLLIGCVRWHVSGCGRWRFCGWAFVVGRLEARPFHVIVVFAVHWIILNQCHRQVQSRDVIFVIISLILIHFRVRVISWRAERYEQHAVNRDALLISHSFELSSYHLENQWLKTETKTNVLHLEIVVYRFCKFS